MPAGRARGLSRHQKGLGGPAQVASLCKDSGLDPGTVPCLPRKEKEAQGKRNPWQPVAFLRPPPDPESPLLTLWRWPETAVATLQKTQALGSQVTTLSPPSLNGPCGSSSCNVTIACVTELRVSPGATPSDLLAGTHARPSHAPTRQVLCCFCAVPGGHRQRGWTVLSKVRQGYSMEVGPELELSTALHVQPPAAWIPHGEQGAAPRRASPPCAGENRPCVSGRHTERSAPGCWPMRGQDEGSCEDSGEADEQC